VISFAVVTPIASIKSVPIGSDACLEAEASPRGSKSLGLASTFFDASPRSCLGFNVMISISYVTISLFTTFIHSSIVYMCLRPLRQNFIYVFNSVFRCKLNVFGVCVLHEYSLIYIYMVF